MRKWIIALALLCAAPLYAAETLDNQAVVEMVKLGLDTQVISAKIDASPNHFDTSPKALARLKHAGVSSALISKMINAGSTIGHAGPANTSGDRVIEYVGASGRRAPISPVRVTAELSYRKAWIPFHTGGPETFMYLQGRHAPLRTSTSPEFTTDLDPLTVRLIHLGQKNDQESRFVVFSGSNTDREVEVTSTKLADGNYSIKPSKPLRAGEEYAFLVVAEAPAGAFWTYFAQNTASSRAYDFGVD
jgi:hypothetical protein